MTSNAAAPIAEAVHERLLQLGSDLSEPTVEEVALAMVAGVGRYLRDTASVPSGEIVSRIVAAAIEDAASTAVN